MRQEMVLQCTLGLSLLFTEDEISRPREALTRASELAESRQDFDYQLQALYGLVAICLRLEDFQGALAFARRSAALPNVLPTGTLVRRPTASSARHSFFFVSWPRGPAPGASTAEISDRLITCVPDVIFLKMSRVHSLFPPVGLGGSGSAVV
jgi:hypothetical protein